MADQEGPGKQPEERGGEENAPYPWMTGDVGESDSPPFRPWMIAVAGASVLIFALAVWYAWNEGQSVSEGPPPVVKAEEGPAKIPPEEPGGMDVPHRDKTVYEAADGDEGTEAEELLPPPEEPVELPDEEAGEEAAAQSADTDAQSADTDAQSAGTEAPEAETMAPDTGPDTAEEPSTTATAPAAEETAEPSAETTKASEPDRPERAEPAAKPAAPAPGEFIVQLGAFSSRDSAKTAWSGLAETHADILGDRSPDITVAELDRGTFYRLGVAMGNRAGAEALCASLTERGQNCFVKER